MLHMHEMKQAWFRSILFVFLFLLQPLQSIELDRVILSCNNNPNYIEFWPIVAPMWQAIGLQPTLALVANEDCIIDTSLGDVIRFEPLDNVSEALQTQVLRLMLPILFPNDGCLIADIDMLPVSKVYFHKGAECCPSDAFLIYRDRAFDSSINRYPMCYVAAQGHVFSSLFGISNVNEFSELIRNWASQGMGWDTDELTLYRYLTKWEKHGNRVIRLGHCVEWRLDRSDWKTEEPLLDISRYIDCHCPRPYSAYKTSIDQIVQAIYASWGLCYKENKISVTTLVE